MRPLPLSGIWATAPYLHNGSMPTLYHPLAGDRPGQFYRANTTYDEKMVGSTWDRATSAQAVMLDANWQGYPTLVTPARSSTAASIGRRSLESSRTCGVFEDVVSDPRRTQCCT